MVESDLSPYDTNSELVTPSQLDGLLNVILSPKTGYFEYIVTFLKLIAVGIVLIAKWALMRRMIDVAKMKYEIKQNNTQNNTINQDNLD